MPRSSNGAKLIVFVIGGATYSEIRSAYEIAETYSRDVFIGTTELLRPTSFVEQLGHLRLPVPSPKSLIPPYVPPPPQPKSNDSLSKTASLMSAMHLSSSSSPHLSNKSSNISLSDKMSSSSTTNTEEKEKEKKKKKGLKRFF
jgi:syntaxin-binding protein 1